MVIDNVAAHQDLFMTDVLLGTNWTFADLESWKYKTVAKTLQQEKRLEKDKRQYANEKLLSPPNTVSNPDVAQLGDEAGERSYWLMKAEPNSRIEKGVDVKFSIDDLKNVTAPEPWEGLPQVLKNLRDHYLTSSRRSKSCWWVL